MDELRKDVIGKESLDTLIGLVVEEINRLDKKIDDIVIPSTPDTPVLIDEVDPSKVIFKDGVQTTYPVGKVTLDNGIAMLIPPGGSLADYFTAYMDEKNPETTDPSVSLTFSQAKAYEVGTKVTPSFSAVLNPGSYTYGPDTGITPTKWEVTDTKGNSKSTASGSFPEVVVTDGISYKITAKATYGDGTVPITNAKNPYPDGQIKGGTKSATSSAITGYRNSFYGTLTNKDALTSDIARGLTKSGKALANGNSFTVNIPVGAMRVVIVYPATLRNLSSVKDVNGMNAEIVSGFSYTTLSVEGANKHSAISYKVAYMDFANAVTTANKFTVTI